MIPITVSFFLKQSEKEHHRPVTLASIYCLAIVGTFTFIGMAVAIAFRATELTALANNGWINVFIAGVLVFFGMNLLGLFEIRIPSGLLTWSAGKESQGGIVGVMFMAITFTLVSFTCTFAFVGGLLVMASKGQYYWPLIGLLAFSLAFSLPFFFLALFPSYLQKLPKSGGWMNRVKVTLGMIEVGAAFKFLSVADLAWNPVPAIFDYGLVMSAWVVISICTGMYLLNLYRLPHDTPSETVPVPQLALAMTFLGLAGYLCVGLFAPEKPRGKIWEQIAAFATPTFEGGEGEIGPYLEHDGLQYALDVNEAIKYAKAKKQLLFLDFTGVNCLNCRLMEGRMAQPANRQLLQKFVRVQLFIDKLPHIKDRALGAKLLERNRGLAENWFGDVSMPSYAVVTPDGKTVLSKFIGMEKNEGDFTAFLDAGLKKWKPGATIRTAVSEKKQDDIGPTLDLDGLTFALDYKRAINKAKTTQHPLFLNFTCMGGIGCRIMEERMKQKHNRDVLEAFVRVQLFVDRLPLSDESDLEATLLRQNRELQETWFGDISTPAFAIVTPDGKTILSKFVGTEQNEGDFAAFLEEGLASWKKVAAAETPTKVRVAGQ
jgi:thiol:disulfide interchange protein DsbD